MHVWKSKQPFGGDSDKLITNVKHFVQRPYIGRTRKEIRDHILSKQMQIKERDIPRGWSCEAADFVNRVSSINLASFVLVEARYLI